MTELSKKAQFAKLPKLKTLRYKWISNGSFWYLPYFHSHDYKYLLGGPNSFTDFTNKKISCRKWDQLYDSLAGEFKKARLPLYEFSKEHSKIISLVFNIPLRKLMKEYHAR